MLAKRLWFALVIILLVGAHSTAGEVALLPSSARLDGPRATQRFLVEARDQGAWVADLTRKAVFSSDNPRVANVAADGTIAPVGNGSATITAKVDGRTARASVSVENIERDEPWSFQNH